MSNINCPKCLFQFNAEENFKYRIDGPASFPAAFIRKIASKRHKPLFKKQNIFLDEISEAILTICPNCKNEFPFDSYRFFGFLSVKKFKTITILYILGFTLFVGALIIIELMK